MAMSSSAPVTGESDGGLTESGSSAPGATLRMWCWTLTTQCGVWVCSAAFVWGWLEVQSLRPLRGPAESEPAFQPGPRAASVHGDLRSTALFFWLRGHVGVAPVGPVHRRVPVSL